MNRHSNRSAQVRSFIVRIWNEQSGEYPYRIALRCLPNGEWQICHSMEAVFAHMRAQTVPDQQDLEGDINHES